MNISLLTFVQPFDAIVSIILFYFIYSGSNFYFINYNKQKLNFFEIFNLFIIFLSLLLYILINFQLNYISFRYPILIIIILLSIFFTVKTSPKFIDINLDKKYYFFFGILFLLSLSPPTDADSLDYHIGVPLEIIKNGKLIFRDDWFHSYLMGYGEMVNLFGLINGSKNFGQIINFIAIINIFYVFSLFKKENKNSLNIYYFLFSIPLILWFTTSSKPQLYQSSLILYAFYLLISSIKLRGIISNKNIIILSVFFSYCVYSKLSFVFIVLSSNILFLFFLEKKQLRSFLIINIIVLSIISAPKLITDFHVYGKILFPYSEKFLNNPNLEILEFLETIRNDSATFYSISKNKLIFFPILNSISLNISNITGLLGLSFCFIYLSVYYLVKSIFKNINNKVSKYIFLLILINILILAALPNFQPRYLLEIYWLNTITLVLFLKSKEIIKLLNFINKYQSIAIALFSIISIYNLSSGSLSHENFLKVSRKVSHNFNESEWILENTEKGKVILNQNMRSSIFMNNFLSREKYFKYFKGDQVTMLKEANFDYIVLYYPLEDENIKSFVNTCTDYENSKINNFNVNTRNFLSKIRTKSFQLILLKKTC